MVLVVFFSKTTSYISERLRAQRDTPQWRQRALLHFVSKFWSYFVALTPLRNLSLLLLLLRASACFGLISSDAAVNVSVIPTNVRPPPHLGNTPVESITPVPLHSICFAQQHRRRCGGTFQCRSVYAGRKAAPILGREQARDDGGEKGREGGVLLEKI